MDFGRLSNIENVDFTLKADPENNQDTFNSLIKQGPKQQKLYIGASKFAVKEWLGLYYPIRAKSKDYMHFCAEQFNANEVNTTFYGIPDSNAIIKWYKSTNLDFKFCIKVYRNISRSKTLGEGTTYLKKFIESTELLADKLGPAFLQLPPTSSPSIQPALLKFIETVTPRIPLSIEFRHPDWFTSKGINIFDKLREMNVSSVITDTAGRRDVCHLQVTNSSVFIRFAGNNLVPSDYVRINDWIDKMIHWFEMGVKDIYFFIHEPMKIDVPTLANYLGKEWQKKSLIETRYPELLNDNGDNGNKKQLSLFDL
ncbi:MAG TPA: DUF72 domain-containing protein [Saprospiraceae bacterium]|nr:DUF72 domain-containing protein [Saprospiraceae bacterium]